VSTTDVISGQVVSGLQISGQISGSVFIGNGLLVEAGGTAIDTVVVQEEVDVFGITRGSILSAGDEVVSSGGTASGTTVNNGGEQDIEAGGTASGTTVNDGGLQDVYGTASNTILSGDLIGGEQDVESGGTASGTIVSSGGWQEVEAGGTASGTTVDDGGWQDVSGTAIDTTLSGSEQVVYSGGAASGTVLSGGEQNVWGAATSTTVMSGGLELVWGTDAATTVNNGGEQDVEAGGTASGTTVDDGGVLEVVSGAIVSDISFASGGVIDFSDLTYSAGDVVAYDSATQQLSVTAGGTTETVGLATTEELSSSSFVLANDAANGSLEVELPCFFAGTLISTPGGAVAVEHLRVDDLVYTHGGGLRPIKWLGHRDVNGRHHLRPGDIMPVRVRADAFGDGAPRRDLLLSPDHAVFVGGVLIPIRYLVNGATVVQEEIEHISYWHVELNQHDVLLAEGLPCESYLDTGNRGAFINGGATVQAHPDFALRVWDTQACAKLVLKGPLLTMAKRDVLARAIALGHAMTDDPDLKVLAGAHALVTEPCGSQWRVLLPAACENVRLISRIWSPVQMRPAEDDARSLGVAISRLWLDRREVSLESPGLVSGWQAPEPDWRWTDGDARLAVAGMHELIFEVAMTGSYWRDDPVRSAARAA
jgi:autotransporter passenger strand-loop-strand repeat protein